MKRTFFIILLIWVAAARADEVEVYDYSTGEYSHYDVHRRGRNVGVYDWNTGTYRDYTFSSSERDIYDWQTGSSLDLKGRGCGRFEVYDWEKGTHYDVKVKHR